MHESALFKDLYDNARCANYSRRLKQLARADMYSQYGYDFNRIMKSGVSVVVCCCLIDLNLISTEGLLRTVGDLLSLLRRTVAPYNPRLRAYSTATYRLVDRILAGKVDRATARSKCRTLERAAWADISRFYYNAAFVTEDERDGYNVTSTFAVILSRLAAFIDVAIDKEVKSHLPHAHLVVTCLSEVVETVPNSELIKIVKKHATF